MDILNNEDFHEEYEGNNLNGDVPSNQNPMDYINKMMNGIIPKEIFNSAMKAVEKLTPEEVEEMLSSSANSLNVKFPINPSELTDMFNSINITENPMSELYNTGSFVEMMEDPNQEDNFILDTWFFKRYALGKGYQKVAPSLRLGKIEPISQLEKLSKYTIFPLMEYQENLYSDIMAAGYTGVISVKNTDDFSIVKIGGKGKATLYIVLYEKDGELVAYIPSHKAPIVFTDDEADGFAMNHAAEPNDYIYNVEQEMKTVFIYNKKISVSLFDVGTVIVGCDPQDDRSFVKFGKIAFKDSTEARLIIKDLELPEDTTETDLYFQLIDPETNITRTLTTQEAITAKEYLKMVNIRDIDGSESFEGRLNTEETAKNIKLCIKNGHLVMNIEIGRIPLIP